MAEHGYSEDDTTDDPLGSVIEQFFVSLAGVLIVGGVVLLVGLGLILAAWIRETHRLWFLIPGGFITLTAGAMIVFSLRNVGRRLELRQQGLRFVESGEETVFFWDEITDIEVERTDDTNLGIVSVERRSSDAVSGSGPLTQTEWSVRIHAAEGRQIHLRPVFFTIVNNPKKLIQELRSRAGL